MKVPTERQLKRREGILAAARQLISEKGYDGVTMRDLAALSNVTPKTLYHQFGNKENLLRTAVEERFRYLYQMIDEAEIERGIDRLFHIIDSVAKTTRENAAYARALAPILTDDSTTTFTLIRMNTYRRAVEQIAAEGELVSWVDVGVLNALILRQVNPIFLSAFVAKAPKGIASLVAKLDISLVLASVTTGYTHKKVIEVAKQMQKKLTGVDYI